ncbi:MAG: hypothetical protein R2883_06650 [Caldisericia bacterium]
MKKYISKIVELVDHNKKAFFWILFISAVVILAGSISDSLLSNTNPAERLFSTLNPDSAEPFATLAIDGTAILLSLAGTVVTVILSAFVEGGFLTYLKKGKQDDKDSYIGYFLENCKAKWGRMIGATFMQYLMIFLYMIAAMILLLIPNIFMDIVINPFSSAFALVAILAIILAFAAIFVLISGLVLTFFITFEAALNKKSTVGEWVKNAFNKGKKVYGQILLWNLMLAILTVGIYFSATISVALFYLLMFGLYLFSWYLEAFVFYPLYELAGDRLKKERNDKLEEKRLEEKILSEYENKNENEEGEDDDDSLKTEWSGFSE